MEHCNLYNRRLFLKPTDLAFENRAVLNPAAVQMDEDVHFYYRAVAQDMISTIGYLRMRYANDEPVVVERWNHPILAPATGWDQFGVEDPRVLQFEGRWYMFYTAFDGDNAQLAYAVGDSPTSFTERHLIGPKVTRREGLDLIAGNPKLEPQRKYWTEWGNLDGFLWEKDATILPERHNGKIVFIHRLRPNAQIAFLDSMDQLEDRDWWIEHIRTLDQHLLLTQENWWEASHMGMGPVPMKTEHGWLFIYHGCTYPPEKTYRAGAALLDLDDPRKVIGRFSEPLFQPEEGWELEGDVNHVVFPEGLVRHGDVLDIFYGGADSVIGVISVKMPDLLGCLMKK